MLYEFYCIALSFRYWLTAMSMMMIIGWCSKLFGLGLQWVRVMRISRKQDVQNSWFYMQIRLFATVLIHHLKPLTRAMHACLRWYQTSKNNKYCKYTKANILYNTRDVQISDNTIGIFESPKYDVNPQPNTRGIGPLVGRTSGNRRSVMHVLAVIYSITYHFFFICQYIFIQVILSGREICPLLMYPGTFLVF